ncbi:dynamin family protein [Amphritea sp. 2_MG-2023]|uniref:dynamin family protein n=1 Tax=Amphritea TaxID=515417 RepID=UPI001C066D3C|nr:MULTISPECIES: dynamin family protein [Amphritea]MBU2964027.1 dynamin family protein [Amphritea atlantica]MDO6418427.1 dynamin family protein [Amphritea sp. 2_MG-2023]
MHTKNLEILKNEASRLIELESRLLTSIRDTPGLVSGERHSVQTFDSKSILQGLEVLSGERHKLETMDMVVAVVGTMKAGKSTTINAIVGNEILPNRNGPMTSIPTLIRHTKGNITPTVSFKNNAPINDLCMALFDVFGNKPDVVARLYEESTDMADVIDFVKSREKVKTNYQGREGIFELLKMVNDLVRICRELGQEFPFSDYDEMHELPVIEVEFTSLSEKESGLGNLTLLDTPGPNEAGQQHLKAMMRDQLRKASAVIAVLNYTQLKSESDEDLRNEVNAIADMAKGRMYAFVNKFDQRSYNDPDEEGVKKMVNNLLAGSIPEDSVFAVSAQQAFLGEVIQKFIRDNGTLPDPDEYPWVEEFARDCFGRNWQTNLNNIDEVLKEARSYWIDSGFELPLEKVVHAAHQSAAYYALDSTASKLVFLSERISNFVNGRETALQKTTLELQECIAALKSDVDRISALRESKEKQSTELFNNLKAYIETCLTEAIREATKIVNQLFTDGVIEHKKEKEKTDSASAAKRAKAGKNSTHSQVKRTLGMAELFEPMRNLKNNERIKQSNGSNGSNKEKLDIGKRKIEFPTREEAKKFVSNFEKALQPPTLKLNENMSVAVDNALGRFEHELKSEIVVQAGEILNEVSDRLGREGFDISLKIPSDVQAKSLGLAIFSMGSGIREDTKTVTRLKEQGSAFGGVKRFFGDFFGADWGYDEVKEVIDVYKVSLDDLNTQTQKTIKKQGNNWRYEIEKEVEEPVRAVLGSFFDELEKKVEVVRGDLLQGIHDKEKSQSEQDELLSGLKAIAKNVPGIIEDSEELKGDALQNLEEKSV